MGQDYRRTPDEDDDHLDTMPRRTGGATPPAPSRRGVEGEIIRPTATTPPDRGAAAPPDRATLYVPADGAPPPPAPTPPRRGTGNACIWLLALAAMVVLACGLLGAGVLNNGINGVFGMVPRFPNIATTPVVSIQPQGPSVVEQVQALSRLETARYTVKTIMTGQSVGSVIGIVPGNLTTDKILFLAYGNVVAGVDLSKLRPEDVQVVSNTVTMRLPAAEIFNYTLDNSKSTVYDRQTGIFTQANPNLETEVRQRAELEIRAQALEDGVLKTAQDNAETTLRTLLHGLHYDHVTFLPPSSVAPNPATAVPSLVPDTTPTP
ncbi:MAG: DUF4230 domain-containing protein [Chloroflexota bacterium]|nr:DUF4230 domain-containing protein [Chloroflexota bacterium]